MADIKSPPEREHDKRILIGIVTDIREQLRIIVFDEQKLFRTEYRPYFPGPWKDIEARLSQAEEALEKDDFNWEYVEGAGLVRDSLKFKRDMLTEAMKQGVVARLLKIINSLLGSLAGALPVLEAVKEYKDHVEAAIAIQNRWE